MAPDGLVQIKRQVILDERLSAYVCNAALLKDVHILSPVEGRVADNCQATMGCDKPIALTCSISYHIVAMPTLPEATLTFPGDLLLVFLADGLAYQPLALNLAQEIVVTVPGEILPLAQGQRTRSPVYASRSTKAISEGPSSMRLQSEVTLAPGDLANPRLWQIDPIRFKPILGMP